MKNDQTDQYADIMELPRSVSKKHPQMTLHDRAAQFAPFAALTGYHASVEETADTHSHRVEFEEEVREPWEELP